MDALKVILVAALITCVTGTASAKSTREAATSLACETEKVDALYAEAQDRVERAEADRDAIQTFALALDRAAFGAASLMSMGGKEKDIDISGIAEDSSFGEMIADAMQDNRARMKLLNEAYFGLRSLSWNSEIVPDINFGDADASYSNTNFIEDRKVARDLISRLSALRVLRNKLQDDSLTELSKALAKESKVLVRKTRIDEQNLKQAALDVQRAVSAFIHSKPIQQDEPQPSCPIPR